MSAYIAQAREINLLFPEAEGMYRRLIESVRCGVYMADKRGTLFFVNQAFVNILGYTSKEEVLGLNLAAQLYVNPRDREVFLQKLAEKGYVANYVVRNLRKDGSVVILSATSHFIRNEKGETIGVEGIVADITETVHLEEQLKKERLKLEEILGFDEKIYAIRKIDRLIDFVVKKAADILEARRCSIMLLDSNSDELCIQGAIGLDDDIIKNTRLKVGESIAGFVAKEKIPVLVKNIEYDPRFQRKNRDSHSSRSFMSVPIKLDDILIGVINLADKNGHEPAFFDELDFKILKDLAREVAVAIENVKLYKELSYLTVVDPLTHIRNYRYFTKSLEYEIERAERFDSPLCLLMIDIDDFKSYNDIFGHVAGDILLKELSDILGKNLRSIDILCRYAGDEFVVILPGTNIAGAKNTAEKMRKIIETTAFQRRITMSVGIAKYTPGMGRYELVLSADSALYQAKREGKNKVI